MRTFFLILIVATLAFMAGFASARDPLHCDYSKAAK